MPTKDEAVQQAWDWMGRTCRVCQKPLKPFRAVVISYPGLGADACVEGFSFRTGQTIDLCVDCGLDVFQGILKLKRRAERVRQVNECVNEQSDPLAYIEEPE